MSDYDLNANVNGSQQPAASENKQSATVGERRSAPKLMAAGILVMLAAVVLVWWQHSSAPTSVAVAQRQATVTITDAGFTPAELHILPGTTVTWQNETGAAQAVGSNPYPLHTSLPQLVSGSLSPNQSYSFIFSKTGTWIYQDDLNPLHSGTIVVK